ncbi:DUF6584 family protein [Streptomyces atroolivaceus]|uniref:DUF6584 family protein n=1 Tax=Streptomyces atroolivaceus TaxID=66869 RepID=A0ABV9V7K3_STRAZ|nr:DUF6584 family protein [Streptomyces atroolivaceus]
MALTDTLRRVDADLAAGRIPMARMRLRGLVAAYPASREVRRRLGEIYRLYGEPEQAGRWMYLEEDRDPAETAAFEQRYHLPAPRMKAVAWRGPESLAGSAFAEEQLAALRTACSTAAGRPVDWDTVTGEEQPERSAALRAAGCTGAFLLVAGFLAIWVNGLVDLFD